MESGIFPVLQDYFEPDSRTIEEILLQKVLPVDAVICLNRHFYVYEPPRDLAEIEADMAKLEEDIVVELREVVG